MRHALLFLALLSLSALSAQRLPGVFERSSPQERWKAVRAAELDAYRQLAERLYGSEIAADTLVFDQVLADDQIAARVQELIYGAKSSGQPIYHVDGRVTVEKTLHLSNAYALFAREPARDVTLSVTGEAALPGTSGMAKLEARRAAELDAYRQLAERIHGALLTSATRVRDFQLEEDRLQAQVDRIIRGARRVDLRYDVDGTAYVTLALTMQQVRGLTQGFPPVAGEDTATLSVTGVGLPRMRGVLAEHFSPQPVVTP